MDNNCTIAAISTPPGMGGIAIIRISGDQSYSIANSVFIPSNRDKNLLDAKGYTALFGEFKFRNKIIDQGIALCFRAPHSYTGEDVVEFSCHGGGVVSEEVLLACIEAGAEPASAGEFTKRAVLNERLSLTQAEAVMDLISASSRQAAAAAKAALSGSLYKEINEQKLKLVELAGHITAFIDYPEEGVEEPEIDKFILIIDDVIRSLEMLIDGYSKGAILRRGVRAVIIGSPNVGKSTLFNLLFGYDRAIVTPVAGTTRDVVREEIDIGGIPLLLSDTAGLHETKDLVETEGIRRSFLELEQAGLIIAVFDGSTHLTEEDMELVRHCKGKPALALVNKSDLGTIMGIEEIEPNFTKTLSVSAIKNESRKSIEQAVLDILKMDEIDTNAAMLANERQLYAAISAKEALIEAKSAIEIGMTLDAMDVCLEDAISNLSAITGESVNEIVLEEVFSKFCVGK